eukprot:jgi/Ulvmu1/10770/UM069_0004.1
MMSRDGSALLSRQIRDALPAEPDALAAVAAQITELALERANDNQVKQTEALQNALSTRDAQATELQARCDDLLADHVALTDDLAAAHETIARLEGEKSALADSVRTLAERVQKLEAFKRTLIASLQDDGGAPVGGGGSGSGGAASVNGGLWGEAKPAQEGDRLVREILANAKPAHIPKHPSLSKADSGQHRRGPYGTNGSHSGYSKTPGVHAAYATPAADGARAGSYSGAHGDTMASPMVHGPHVHPLNQPHLMHDNPPPSQQPWSAGSAAAGGMSHSVQGTPVAAQGNENSMAAGNAGSGTPVADGSMKRGSGHGGTPADTPAQPQRVDGKDFFKQARTRLPYESFAAFLQNIKDLNTGKQSRDETLERSRTIFGANNADLFVSFQGLLARHLSSS